MLHVIKWELVKQFHRLKWIILIFAAILLTLTILPANWFKTENNATSPILLLFSMILSFGTAGLLFYPMYSMISDFRRKTYTMERIAGTSRIPVFLSKIFINLAIFFLATGLGYAGTNLMDKFSTESTHYFTYKLNVPFFEMRIDVVLLYPAILLFCYMAASTNRYFRNHRTIGTLIGLVIAAMIGSNIHLSGPVHYVVGLIIGIALFIASGWLADRGFEQHVNNY